MRRTRRNTLATLGVVAVSLISFPVLAKPLTLGRTRMNTDYVSAGTGGIAAAPGTISVTGVFGTVHQAFLYWHGIDNSGSGEVYDNETIVFAGNQVAGTSLGDTETNCWGAGSSRAFFADVTDFVGGNGNYSISGLNALPGHSGNGASLVVLFNDVSSTNNRDLYFYEGNDSDFLLAGSPDDANGWAVTLGDINYAGGSVFAQLHVADGQSFADASINFAGASSVSTPDTDTLWDGKSVPNAGSNRGTGGDGLWDIHTFDMTGSLGPPGTQTVNLTGMEGTADCHSLVLLILDQPAGTLTCGNGSLDTGEVCDPSRPQDIACCSAACQYKDIGTTCRSAVGACDITETCNGISSLCPADQVRSSTTFCRPSAGFCDSQEKCTGSSGFCPADTFNGPNIRCRSATDICDAAEFCSGAAALCPTDIFASSSVECRAAVGSCDTVEFCNGASGACPSDSVASSAKLCRAASGVCDVGETCSGTSKLCPTDVVASTATPCRSAAGACDIVETCNGTSVCPADSVASSTTLCRTPAGVCDIAETCSGSSKTCPTDQFKTAANVCRSSGGVCDIAEQCTGNSPSCPSNTRHTSDFTCRASAGPCDPTEKCNGQDNCPTNLFSPSTQACGGDGGECGGGGMCTGNSAACPAALIDSNGEDCSDGVFCNGADTCLGGQCVTHAGSPCDGPDGVEDKDCSETCNETADDCSRNDPDGSVCDKGDDATQDSCSAGQCERLRGPSEGCTSSDQCGPALPGDGCSRPELAYCNSVTQKCASAPDESLADSGCNEAPSAAECGAPGVSCTCGDATSDGALSATDALRALKAAVGQGVDCPLCACDVAEPRDGFVKTSDSLMLLRTAVGADHLTCGQCFYCLDGERNSWVTEPNDCVACAANSDCGDGIHGVCCNDRCGDCQKEFQVELTLEKGAPGDYGAGLKKITFDVAVTSGAGAIDDANVDCQVSDELPNSLDVAIRYDSDVNKITAEITAAPALIPGSDILLGRCGLFGFEGAGSVLPQFSPTNVAATDSLGLNISGTVQTNISLATQPQ